MLFAKKKKTAAAGAEKRKAKRSTFSVIWRIELFFTVAAASASSGIIRVENESRKADGKVRSGIAIPAIMPYFDSESLTE